MLFMWGIIVKFESNNTPMFLACEDGLITFPKWKTGSVIWESCLDERRRN